MFEALLGLAGGAFSAYGDVQQGKMTSASLNKQADNLQQQAQEAEAKGQYDAMRNQMISASRIGSSQAAYGAGGVSANSGSVLDVIQASHTNAELDRLNILHGADIRAINYQNQANMDRYAGKNAIQGSYWQALGSLTGGAVKGVSNLGGASPGTSGSSEGAGLDETGAGNYSGAEASAGADSAGEMSMTDAAALA